MDYDRIVDAKLKTYFEESKENADIFPLKDIPGNVKVNDEERKEIKKAPSTARRTHSEEAQTDIDDASPAKLHKVSDTDKENTTRIFDAAKKKFGVTKDIREAGYVLPDVGRV